MIDQLVMLLITRVLNNNIALMLNLNHLLKEYLVVEILFLIHGEFSSNPGICVLFLRYQSMK